MIQVSLINSQKLIQKKMRKLLQESILQGKARKKSLMHVEFN